MSGPADDTYLADGSARPARRWLVAAVAAGLGLAVGYVAAAYPLVRGEYALPNLRRKIAEVGEPSPMDDLYNRSLLACIAMTDQPPFDTDGGSIVPRKTRKLSKFMDDWKIVGTNERQFAAAICSTYLSGKMAGLTEKPTGIWMNRTGTYDGEYQ